MSVQYLCRLFVAGTLGSDMLTAGGGGAVAGGGIGCRSSEAVGGYRGLRTGATKGGGRSAERYVNGSSSSA